MGTPSKVIEERILRLIRSPGFVSQTVTQLADALGVPADEREGWRASIDSLRRAGFLFIGRGDVVSLPKASGCIRGTYRAKSRGFGFLMPEKPLASGDLYVGEGQSGGALDGDLVEARILKRGKRHGNMLYEARVTEVVERRHQPVVGELRRNIEGWYVVPDGNVLRVPVQVDDPGAKDAHRGDQVVVELTEYPDGSNDARGVIIRVLGRRGEPAVETLSIIEQYGLPGEFAEDVIREARRVSTAYKPQQVLKGREDLRRLTTVTIDPVDARDFDDAISLEERENGCFELGVHIADVSHFVRPGTALDVEARSRSNSVYLPRTVIPMLPEVLSNGVCSLQERQVRLTKSVFLVYDKRGRVRDARLTNSVIKSTKRLAYQEVDAVLGGQPGRTSAKVVTLLQRMETLAKRIRRRRLREGMLELDLPESDLVFDQEGRLDSVMPADSGFSHKIIEMFMVEANEAVARALTDRAAPFLRRIHDEPRDFSSGELQAFLGALGQSLPKNADRFDVQKLLTKSGKTQAAHAVHFAVLRSMRPAEYSPIPMGHFALASEHYCHFTSPIRRYPDLTVHRLFDLLVSGELDAAVSSEEVPPVDELVELGRQCSENERRAEAAERELRTVLILRLLKERHLGGVFDGTITGNSKGGLFVQLDEMLIEGRLAFSQLPDDWWEISSSRAFVRGERSGRTVTVGDRLKVRIAAVEVPARRLELALGQKLAGGSSTAQSRTRKSTDLGDENRNRRLRTKRGKGRRAGNRSRRRH